MSMQSQRQKPSAEAITSPGTQSPGAGDPTITSPAEYAQFIGHLFNIGQILCGQAQGVAERFCQEVALVTQERAQLQLHQQKSSSSSQAIAQNPSRGFPVQFRDRNYGTLYVASDPAQLTSPAFPLPLAQLLAQTCAWLLFTFELAACLPMPATHADATLTRREKEVLLLMCRGYSREAIARALSITLATVSKHRQHIFEHLVVHNGRDATVAAYQAGLFSPLEDL